MRNQKEEAVKQNASVGYLLCCVLIGLLFLLFPGWVIGTLSLLLGILCIAYGAWKLFTALRSAKERTVALREVISGRKRLRPMMVVT